MRLREKRFEPFFVVLIFSSGFGNGLREEAPGSRRRVGMGDRVDYDSWNFVFVGLEAAWPFLNPSYGFASDG